MVSHPRMLGATISVLFAVFGISAVCAQTPPGTVKYYTELTEERTTALITEVVAGNKYVLNAYVQDLTPNGNGVFAAYMDVHYDPMVVQVDGPIQHSRVYSQGTSGSTAVLGLIDEVGGFDGLRPLSTNPAQVFSIALEARSSGAVDFQLSAPEGQSQRATLRYNQNDPVPVACIDFGTGRTDFPTSCLQNVPEPTGAGLWLAVLLMLCPALRRNFRRASVQSNS